MNTNADALSRIELNSDVLKQMIPLENDENEKKVLITTRAMKRKDENANIEANKNKEINMDEERANGSNIEKCISQESDQLLIWECTSVNDIKNMKKLQFNEVKNIEEIEIRIENNIVHIGRDDNSSKQDSIMKKSRTQKDNYMNNGCNDNSSKPDSIMKKLHAKNNNKMHARFSDNSAKLDSILRKLISKKSEGIFKRTSDIEE